MLKLKLQYFGHLMRRADSLEKTLMLEKTEGRRRRGWQRMRWLQRMASSPWWTWVWANSETVKDREAWHAAVHGVTKSQTWLSDWRHKHRTHRNREGVVMARGRLGKWQDVGQRVQISSCKMIKFLYLMSSKVIIINNTLERGIHFVFFAKCGTNFGFFSSRAMSEG